MGIPSFMRSAFEGYTTCSTDKVQKVHEKPIKSYGIIEMVAKPNPKKEDQVSVIVPTAEPPKETKTESTALPDCAIAKTKTKPSPKKQAKKVTKKQKK